MIKIKKIVDVLSWFIYTCTDCDNIYGSARRKMDTDDGRFQKKLYFLDCRRYFYRAVFYR